MYMHNMYAYYLKVTGVLRPERLPATPKKIEQQFISRKNGISLFLSFLFRGRGLYYNTIFTYIYIYIIFE